MQEREVWNAWLDQSAECTATTEVEISSLSIQSELCGIRLEIKMQYELLP